MSEPGRTGDTPKTGGARLRGGSRCPPVVLAIPAAVFGHVAAGVFGPIALVPLWPVDGGCIVHGGEDLWMAPHNLGVRAMSLLFGPMPGGA